MAEKIKQRRKKCRNQSHLSFEKSSNRWLPSVKSLPRVTAKASVKSFKRPPSNLKASLTKLKKTTQTAPAPIYNKLVKMETEVNTCPFNPTISNFGTRGGTNVDPPRKLTEKKEKKAKMKKKNNSNKDQTKTPMQRSRHKYMKVLQDVVISMKDCRVLYAEAMRKLKENLDLDKIGVTIIGIKKMKAGYLIMSVGSGEDAVKATSMLKANTKRVLGPMQQYDMLPNPSISRSVAWMVQMTLSRTSTETDYT